MGAFLNENKLIGIFSARFKISYLGSAYSLRAAQAAEKEDATGMSRQQSGKRRKRRSDQQRAP
jgi:hypothetical protein